MTHRSRIGVVCIDCQTDDLDDAFAFWSAALGRPGKVDWDGKYATFDDDGTDPRVILQAVDHPPRVHLDVETDDKEAERARLEKLGAREVAQIRRWYVMEAPTGHRFCIVNPQSGRFPGDAPEWSD